MICPRCGTETNRCGICEPCAEVIDASLYEAFRGRVTTALAKPGPSKALLAAKAFFEARDADSHSGTDLP